MPLWCSRLRPQKKRLSITKIMGKNISEGHRFHQSLAYSLPILGFSFLIGPITILQGVYAKYFGLSLTVIASIVFISRLFDAVSDPLIGYLSDRYQQRTGSRKAFIFTGGLLFILSSYFLYVPLGYVPSGVGDIGSSSSVSASYFLVFFLAFYLSWTLFEIPHLAWGAEISSTTEERNKLYSLRALMTYIGTALFFVVPLLPFFETSEFTPKTLFWSVILGAILTLPLLFYCAKNVADGTSLSPRPETPSSNNKGSRALWRMVLGNRPFLLFLGAFFFAGAGAGMWVGVSFIFIDVYLGLGEKLSVAYLLSIGISILAVGLWYGVAKKAGKSIAWGLGMLLVLLGDLGTGYVTPGESGWFPLLLCMALIYVGMTATVTLAPSLLSDIIDYGTWKFGQDYAASYFSIYTLVFKANIGVGTALGLAVAGIYGFDPASAIQSDQAIFGLRLSIAWLPALMTLIAIGFIVLTPINVRRHNILRRALDRRTDQPLRKTQQQSQVLNKQPNGLGQLTVSH